MSILNSTGLAYDQSAMVVDGGLLDPIGGDDIIVTNSATAYVISLGETSHYTLTSGETLSVLSGGTDSGSTVYSGATVSVFSGGQSVDDVVSGGALIASGALGILVAISGATLFSGATITALSGAIARGNTFEAGTSALISGAQAPYSAESVGDSFSGARLVVGSGAESFYNSFYSGTTASFGSGVTAENDVVFSGAVASFGSGANANSEGVSSGGELFLANGAPASELKVASGGIIGFFIPYGSGETVSYNSSTMTLTVASGGTNDSVTFQSVPTSPHVTTTSAPGGGTLVTFACFAGGTRIATLSGQTPVESLRAGDLVQTVSGVARPVRWMGYRRLHNADSVRVRAGAFGAGRPARDLVLSPEHAVYTEGVLIPIRHLIDDVSIIQERAEEITYWHVELGSHDVLLVEGLPCESWLDTGNRGMFENAAIPDLHPSFTRGASTSAYAPVVEDGPLIAIARRRLAGRRQVCDVVLPPSGTARIAVAPGTTSIRLISMSGRHGADARRRGALIRAIRLDGAAVPLDDARLLRGFHDIERHGDATVRWTDGSGVIAVAGVQMLEVEVAAAFAQVA